MVLILFVGGCAWMSKPVDPAITGAVETATLTKQQINDMLEKNKAELNDLLAKAELTKQERDDAEKLKSIISSGQNQLSKVDSFLADAKATLANADTNGDLILNSVGALAAAFGIPFVGLGATLLKKKKYADMLKTGIANLEKNRNGEGGVDWANLKIDNADAGINSVIKEARKSA